MHRSIVRPSYIDTKTSPLSPVEQLIGNTPFIRLKQIMVGLNPHVQLWAKAEWFNPGGSIKDRAALNIIRAAKSTGQLTPDKILLDATSGNTGIAYAMIGASLGYRVKLALPADSSQERISILHAYGADLILTDPLEGADGAIRTAREMAAAKPDLYFYADQYSNPFNWKAHYHTTGPEIWRQSRRPITHFVAGMGTSGTMMGIGRFLRAMNPAIKLVAIQPDDPLHGLEGLKHMDSSRVPSILDSSILNETRMVSTEAAYETALRMARVEGLFIGISAAASVSGALQLASKLDSGRIVTVLPDGGYKYISRKFWTR